MTGVCPMRNNLRAVNFAEKRGLWKYGPPVNGATLMVMLFEHSGVKYD